MRHLIRATSLAALVVACATVAAGAADDKRPVTFDDIMNMKGSPDSAKLAFAGTTTPMTRDGRADVYVATIAGKSVEKAPTTSRT